MAKRKRKVSAGRSGRKLSSHDAAILVAIDSMRSDEVYRAAELLRRRGDGGMAKAPEGSDEYKAIRVLIATWMTIATLMKSVKAKDAFFRILPICHMYRALKNEINHLRNTLSQADFAREVQELNDEWEAWLEQQGLSAAYVTAMCGGLTAKFG
jgi:hypothetical protein